MKTKLSPVLAGTFVLGALALIVVALLAFGSSHLFSKPGHFEAYFDESVQGLDSGSPVKLRGVRVGRVVAIRVHYDSKSRQSSVSVLGELDQNVISDQEGQLIKLTDRATLQRLIDEGLRAKIDLAGITGMQFVELDFLDPQLFPAPSLAGKSEYSVVPTVRSGMSELIVNLSKIVSDFRKVDFAGISRELKSLLANANHQVGELDLNQMAAKVTAAAASIEALAGSAETKAAILNFSRTANGMQELAAKLDSQVEPIRADLALTLHSFKLAAESIHKLLDSRNGLGQEAARTLQQVTETAESLQRLSEFLERNPNAILTGKQLPAKKP